MKIKKEPAFSGLLEPLSEEDSQYPVPVTGTNISQKLTLRDCNFDLIKGSAKNKEVNYFINQYLEVKYFYLKRII